MTVGSASAGGFWDRGWRERAVGGPRMVARNARRSDLQEKVETAGHRIILGPDNLEKGDDGGGFHCFADARIPRLP